jgi:hypothetical protein
LASVHHHSAATLTTSANGLKMRYQTHFSAKTKKVLNSEHGSCVEQSEVLGLSAYAQKTV